MLRNQITLYVNSKMRNLQDVLHFKNENHQKRYWDRHEKIVIEKEFNFRSERGELYVERPYKELLAVNYASFYDHEYKRTMYAYVVNVTYQNDDVTRLDIVPDFVSTFCQGKVINQSVSNAGAVIYPLRQHYGLDTYKARLVELKHQDDFPVISYKHHINRREKRWTDFSVIIGSAVNLTKDFGNVDKPKQSSADGGLYDGLIGVVNLYLIPSQKYRDFMNWLEPYPWIQQNLLFNYLVPSSMIDAKDMRVVTLHKQPTELKDMVRTFINGHWSSDVTLSQLTITYEQQLEQLGLKKDRDDHLLRGELVNYRLTDFTNNLLLAPEKIRYGQTLSFKAMVTLGYHNDIKVVPEGYSSQSGNGWRDGESVNYSLQLTPFDELPTSLDTGRLSLAGSAYQRELEKSNTIEGRLNRALNNDNSMKDRVMSGLAIYSSVFAGGGAVGKAANLYQDQYEYERAKLAERKQAGISQPSVSMGTSANSPAISNGYYGVFLETIAAHSNEIRNAKAYYNLFGFKSNYMGRTISPVYSMSIANWVQFKGDWQIKGVGQNEMQVIRDLFEGGVRLWHVTEDFKDGLYGGLDLDNNRPLTTQEMERW